MFSEADAVLAEYELVDSLVNEIEFGAGIITFSETTIQLQVTTATAGCTPLVVPVDSLTLFKLFPGNRIVLHTVSDLLHLWMMTNELEWLSPCTPSGDAELQLLLQPDDMVDFKTNVAPVIAQKRKARSSSRWSATSLLRIKPFTVALTTQSATGAASLPPLPHVPTPLRSPSYHNEPAAQLDEQRASQKNIATAASATAATCHESAPTPAAARQHGSVHIDAVESNPAVHIVRRNKRRVTPDSNSLPSSVCPESPIVNKCAATTTKKHVPPLAARATAPAVRKQPPSTDHDDVPLGQLLFSSHSGGAKASGGPQPARPPVQPERKEPDNVQYDFYDLSSPHHMAVVAQPPQPPTSRKRCRAAPLTSATEKPAAQLQARAATARQPNRSTAKRAAATSKQPPLADSVVHRAAKRNPSVAAQHEVPQSVGKLEKHDKGASLASKSNGSAALLQRGLPAEEPQHGAGDSRAALECDTTEGAADEGAEAELTFDHDASKFFVPLAASVARTSVSAMRPLAPPLPPAGIAVVDEEVSEIKALLSAGVGEENIEAFLKSAARLGRRVKEAKRKRAESSAHLSSEALTGIASLAQDLLHKCASERNGRRSKFFRFYTRTLATLQEKALRITDECAELHKQQGDLTRDIEQLVNSLAEDELRWGTVEEKDVLASISSIHDSLLGAAHQPEMESAVKISR